MNKWCMWGLILITLTGCATGSTREMAAAQDEPAEAVAEASPEPTATEEPTATPEPVLPGIEIINPDNLRHDIPWIDYDAAKIPVTFFIGSNTNKAPLNKENVRKALSMAIDRELSAQIIEAIARENQENYQPASTFTHADVMGRDLYGEVGLVYDPDGAREMLKAAGYEDGEGFPTIELIYYTPRMDELALSIISGWKEVLNIDVEASPQRLPEEFNDAKESDAPVMYITGWAADYFDPKNFLFDAFQESFFYDNEEFFQLVEAGNIMVSDPEARLWRYVDAERILCETDAHLFPLFSYTYSE